MTVIEDIFGCMNMSVDDNFIFQEIECLQDHFDDLDKQCLWAIGPRMRMKTHNWITF